MTEKYNNGGLRGTNIPTGGYSASRTGIWSLDELRSPVAGPGNPNISSVVFQAHFDRGETNAQNWGLNYGTAAVKIFRQVAFSGGIDPYLSSIQSKWGSTALLGGNVYSDVDAVSFAMGSGDFTMEAWWYFDGVTTSGPLIIDMRQTSANGFYPTLLMDSAKKLNFFTNNAVKILGTNALTLGWHHVHYTKAASNGYLGMDGVQEGVTTADTNTYLGAGSQIRIGCGAFSGSISAQQQYVDSVRITKGVALYAGATYTVPTYRFPTHA